MDIVYKNAALNSHAKSSSTSNMMASPYSTNTPQTCRSVLQFVPFIQSSLKIQQMKNLILKERKEYDKKKQIVESGQLTQRGMTKYLKPNRLKWQKNELRLCNTIIETKLKIADLILNTKGGQSRKDILIEKIQTQIESPRQIFSSRTIKSEHNVQQFMDRIKTQTIPFKLRSDAQSPSKINQSQKIIQNFTTTLKTE
ncbi:unnamed protein product [Paramecium pentaurelia]|uniref:Uncharacterized protein n=1 Tax=Paramecium pentaurelia TaxID=43138 RepID=A0A8S1VVH9_9CILI|nr:unnamed protein product [Paramecium pentaurelia]